MKSKNENVLIYARISANPGTIGEPGLETQVSACREYVTHQPGWIVTQEVHVIACETEPSDLSITTLYKKIYNKEVQVILVSDIYRLSPNIETVKHIYELCKRFGCRFESVTDRIHDVLYPPNL